MTIEQLTELLPEEFLSEYTDDIKMGIEAFEDAISRQAVLELQYRIDDSGTLSAKDVVNVEDIEDLPSVTPQPNMGHWIEDTNGTYTDNHDTWECSECGHAQILLEGNPIDNDYNYCPNCGRKMQEVNYNENRHNNML